MPEKWKWPNVPLTDHPFRKMSTNSFNRWSFFRQLHLPRVRCCPRAAGDPAIDPCGTAGGASLLRLSAHNRPEPDRWRRAALPAGTSPRPLTDHRHRQQPSPALPAGTSPDHSLTTATGSSRPQRCRPARPLDHSLTTATGSSSRPSPTVCIDRLWY